MLFNPLGERVPLKSERELDKMRRSGRLASECLAHVVALARPGVTTHDLDEAAVEFAKAHGAKLAAFGYKGYPRSICTSVNHVICHGIPSREHVLKEGDIVGIDVTTVLDGYHGDTAATVPIGRVSVFAKRLVDDALEALRLGILAVAPGRRLGAVGHAIQRFAEGKGYGVVRDFVGHGTGRLFHEPPTVSHIGTPTEGVLLRPGMTFTIEPMINQGTHETKTLADGWTAITRDRSLSAQFEHTIAVTRRGVEILTVQNDDGSWEPPARWTWPTA